MPKLKDEKARLAFQDKMEALTARRRMIWADLAWPVMPKKEDDTISKRAVANAAVALYESDPETIKDGDSFFDTHKDRFITTEAFLSYWPDIKDIWAEQGRVIAYNNKGVWATRSKVAITKTFEAQENILKRTIEHMNYRHELINKKRKMRLPTFAMQRQLPPPIGE